MDFTPLLRAAEQAQELAKQARLEVKTGASEEAFWQALRASQMHLTKDTLQSLAIAALAQRNFRLALTLWQQLKERVALEK
jgi:hypothetical protein